jgi:hypothetical protein
MHVQELVGDPCCSIHAPFAVHTLPCVSLNIIPSMRPYLQALDAHLTATATGNTGAFSSTRDLVLELLAAGADPLSPVGLGTEEAQTA